MSAIYPDAVPTGYHLDSVTYTAPCPHCRQPVTWTQTPAQPWPRPHCPTCTADGGAE